MKLHAGTRLMAVVIRTWQPLPGRRLRIVRMVEGGRRFWGLADRSLPNDTLVTLDRFGPLWLIAGVVK